MSQLEHKSFEYKIEDLDKGTVRFCASVAENVDKGKDLIVSSGAWKETVNSKDDQKRLKHFREHDTTRWVGLPTLDIKGVQLMVTSKLMIKRVDGLDTYELYKACAEAGRTVEHSLGYKAQEFNYKNQGDDVIREIHKMYIGEVTTLSAWGMNPLADEFQVKNLNGKDLIIEESFLSKLLNAKFSDVQLEGIEKLKNKIESEIKSRQDNAKTWLDYIK